LQSANVAVLWAPFHEVQPNGWFWWAKGTGAQFVSLWKYTYDYLTNKKGINNVLWLLPFSGDPDASYFPGKEYVDLAGPDTYDQGQPFASIFTRSVGIVGTTTPIPLHETGVIPDPDAMFPSSAPWVLFSVWAGYEKDTSQNSAASIKATYGNARTITRDEVPNLK
jgi:Glycosyl hydrolase family 26